jgi:hypothetical protein
MSIRFPVQPLRPARLARIACVVAASLWAGVVTAQGDASAGRDAYEKGDYARAAAEWQRGADRDDADAQLGIGQLYEYGLGELKQNYKNASYWYQKAAAKGRTEAEYRLALIWAAGGKSFPPDLVEAYKWVLLATESKGVWGSVAADLKSQLDSVLRPDEKLEAKRRAEAWKEALAAPTVTASPELLAPPAIKPNAGGCPGWPFPTLPCTEQTPSFAGKQASIPAVPGSVPLAPRIVAPPPAKAPLEQLNAALTQFDCAWLLARTSPQGAPMISGTVPDNGQRARLVQVAGRYFPNTQPDLSVDVVPPPLCHSLAEFNAMRLTGLVVDGSLQARLVGGRNELREGDQIRIEVRAPAYPVNLRIDYFSLDGQVLHLWPNVQDATATLGAGQTRVFGNPGAGKTWNAGGAPFGTELIAVVASGTPLDLGASRPEVEAASTYLDELRHALAHSETGAGAPNAMALVLVRTRGR